jgi:hypothetical protein
MDALFNMEANKHKQYQQHYNIQVVGIIPYFLNLFDIDAFISMEISKHTLICKNKKYSCKQ